MKEREIVAQLSKIRELAYKQIEAELLAKGFEGVLPSHGNILIILSRKDEAVPINTIVEQVGKAKSTVTSNLQTLEKYGYIRKRRNAEDSRSTLISFTARGRDLMPHFKEISDRLLTRLYEGIDGHDREKLLKSLAVMEKNLKS